MLTTPSQPSGSNASQANPSKKDPKKKKKKTGTQVIQRFKRKLSVDPNKGDVGFANLNQSHKSKKL